jgi:hypothetical protein
MEVFSLLLSWRQRLQHFLLFMTTVLYIYDSLLVNIPEETAMSSNFSSEQDDSAATLRTDYEQTNEQIRMLTDIRFKLLALIPTATTIAVSVLGTIVAETSLVVGILGFITVFAIAMYDLRNSQIYDACIGRARQLEKQLPKPQSDFRGSAIEGNRSDGLYSQRPGRTRRLFGILTTGKVAAGPNKERIY